MSRTAVVVAAIVVAWLASGASGQEPSASSQESTANSQGRERLWTGESANLAGNPDPRLSAKAAPTASDSASELAIRSAAPVIARVEFVGLRRIRREALFDKMVTRPGLLFSADTVTRDVHTLGQLGWFDDSVHVESDPLAASSCESGGGAKRGVSSEFRRCISLTFYVSERPFVSGIEYTGSRVLSRAQIEKLLSERKLTPRIGEPENRAQLQMVANQIAEALHELAYPDARASIVDEITRQATVRPRFIIADGPHLPLLRVDFTGNPAVSQRELRGEMRQLRPSALFAGLRGKDVYTREAFEEDRAGLLRYYRNHGYLEARVGQPSEAVVERQSGLRFLLFAKSRRRGLALSVPVEAGPAYKIDSLHVSEEVLHAAGANAGRILSSAPLRRGSTYSDETIENLRQIWQRQVLSKPEKGRLGIPQEQVEAVRRQDPESRTVRVSLRLSDSGPYIVRRLQFEGMKRLSDRYLRRRMPLKEGTAFDERALHAGLTRIQRTGYFKPIKPEDVRVETDDLTRTVDVTIR